MTIAKNFQGAWVCSDIVRGVLEHHTYMGYTKKEAMSMFKKHCKKLEKIDPHSGVRDRE